MAELLETIAQVRDEVQAVHARMDSIEAGVRDAVRDGVLAGLRELLHDEDAVGSFWKRGYGELVSHTSEGASQWIGKRILTAALVAILVAVVTWLVKLGSIK